MCAVSVSATLASARLPLILVSCAGRVRNSRTPSRLKSIIVYKSGLIDPAGVRSSRHVMRSGLFTPRFPCSWACRRHRAQSPRAEPKRRGFTYDRPTGRRIRMRILHRPPICISPTSKRHIRAIANARWLRRVRHMPSNKRSLAWRRYRDGIAPPLK